MRFSSLVTALLLTLILAKPASPAQNAKGSIEGSVYRAGSNEPIADVRLTLARAGGPLQPGSSPPAPVPSPSVSSSGTIAVTLPSAVDVVSTGRPASAIPVVTTDSQGHFSFNDLPAGSYRLTAASNGYVTREYGQRGEANGVMLLSLLSGETLRDVVIRLAPTGTVTGRLRDDSGQPVVGITVQLLKPVYSMYGERTLQFAASSRTDDRGEFRLYYVTPGQYYVFAGPPAGSASPPGQSGRSSVPNEVTVSYGPMFYPGSSSIDGAIAIDVKSAAETNAEFALKKAGAFRIRGRVIDTRTEQNRTPVTVSMTARSVTGSTMPTAGSGSYNPSDGTFQYVDLPPGDYTITASAKASAPSTVSSNLSQAAAADFVSVSNSDVDGITLTIVAPVAITGHIHMDGLGDSSAANMNRMLITLLPAAGTYTDVAPTVRSSTDGNFTLDGMLPGDYRVVTYQNLPPNQYVKDIRFGEADALHEPLHFVSGSSGRLEITLSEKAARISGTVSDEKLLPVSNVQVVLIPVLNRDQPERYRNVGTDPNGHFSLSGIPPGDYKIFAWEGITPYRYFDQAFVGKTESLGRSIHLVERANETVDVKVIPAEQ